MRKAVTYCGYLVELTLDAKTEVVDIYQRRSQIMISCMTQPRTEIVEFVIEGIFAIRRELSYPYPG